MNRIFGPASRGLALPSLGAIIRPSMEAVNRRGLYVSLRNARNKRLIPTALAPWILRDPFNRSGPPSIFDQNFGLGLVDDDFINTALSLLEGGYMRPWRQTPGHLSGTSNISLDKDGLKLNLDVQQFRPEEISVKIMDNFITVEGTHEERSDEHGFISRSFKRRYAIPETIEAEAITSSLTADGVLTIAAPAKKGQGQEAERVIPIARTEAPAAIGNEGAGEETAAK